MPKVCTFFLLACMVCLTGCLDYEVRIQVKPDGSGHIAETIAYSKKAAIFLKRLQFNEKKLKKKAPEYGEGVRYVSGKAIEKNGMKGYTATYAFTDISKVSVGSVGNNLGSSDKKDSGNKTNEQPSSKQFSFLFTKGSPATLVVSALSGNYTKTDGDTEESGGLLATMKMAMVTPFMKDMKIRILVEPQGTITNTNAAFRKGSTITLLAVDMSKVLENTDNTKRILEESKSKDKTTQLNAILKSIPGLQGQTGTIQVQFE